MLGKRHPTALGRPARDSWDDIWDVVGPQADTVLYRGQATWNERVKLVMERHGFSEETFFTWSYSPIYGASGKVDGLFCAVTEETERMRMEAALSESEARFRAFVTASSDVVYNMNADWSEMRQLHGREFNADTSDPSRTWLDRYIHREDQPRVLAEILRAIQTRSMFELEHRVVRVDGTLGWTYSRAVPLFDADGKITEWFGAATDITEQKLTEQLLSAQNKAVELIASGAPLSQSLGALIEVVEQQSDGRSVASILLVDDDGCTLRTAAAPSLPPEYNKAIDGIEAKRDVGTCADAAARNQVVVTPDIAAAESWQGLAYLPLALGLKAAWSMPICAADGRVLGTFGTYFRDCREPTKREREVVAGLCRVAALAIERRQAEGARDSLLNSERAARADAERASHMKDEFLATLSHELRTPLNAILGWSQILAGTDKNPEDIAQGLQTIERNARAQTQIIEDLLDMSRIISGKVRLDVQRLDLAPVIGAAVDTVRPAAEARGIRLQTVLDSHTGRVTGDPGRLQQVFWNLLTNAVKFTPRDGRIQVLLERVNSHLEVSVIDTGEGIDPDFLPHVFDRFRQADASSTRRHGGLGIGLSIVKQLVELHGGTIRARSAGQGHGATFTVSLPVTAVHPEPDGEVERRHPQASTAPPEMPDLCASLKGVRVLVVDDEPDARLLVKRLLEDCHAIVITASSAAEALDVVIKDRPVVIVSDIGMPQEDGYSLLRRIRALPPEQGGQTPAVALTAYARAEDRMKAILSGFQLHVAKPVEPAELITMVSSLAHGIQNRSPNGR